MNQPADHRPVQVEVWSDVACPWCLLGNAHLSEAMRQTGIVAKVELKSFQLSPHLSGTQPVKAYLIEKYGNATQIEASQARLKEMGTKVGLAYNFDNAIVANTFDAHRLHHFAQSKGRGSAVMDLLLRAQHSEGANVSSHALLLDIGVAAGLEPDAVAALLVGDDYGDAVRADIEEGAAIGVQGVPFFVFNRKFALSGAQPVDVFKEALTAARDASAGRDASVEPA